MQTQTLQNMSRERQFSYSGSIPPLRSMHPNRFKVSTQIYNIVKSFEIGSCAKINKIPKITINTPMINEQNEQQQIQHLFFDLKQHLNSNNVFINSPCAYNGNIPFLIGDGYLDDFFLFNGEFNHLNRCSVQCCRSYTIDNQLP